MSQQAATITSLPMAFEVVKAMQADGLEWGEGYRPLGRQALEEIIEDQMAAALSRTCTTCAGGTAPISGYAVGAAVHGLAVERERDRLSRAIAASIAENQTIVTEAAPPQAFQVRGTSAIEQQILAEFLEGISDAQDRGILPVSADQHHPNWKSRGHPGRD